ncbi:MAG: hypothetical protein JSR96_01185 [Proteobacteria bacterium]|nr:hypothetical protein [Pseudomonadota bacterium]
MFTKLHSTTRSTLDKAIVVSIAAMLAMNAFVLAQQQQAPTVVAASVATATVKA